MRTGPGDRPRPTASRGRPWELRGNLYQRERWAPARLVRHLGVASVLMALGLEEGGWGGGRRWDREGYGRQLGEGRCSTRSAQRPTSSSEHCPPRNRPAAPAPSRTEGDLVLCVGPLPSTGPLCPPTVTLRQRQPPPRLSGSPCWAPLSSLHGGHLVPALCSLGFPSPRAPCCLGEGRGCRP